MKAFTHPLQQRLHLLKSTLQAFDISAVIIAIRLIPDFPAAKEHTLSVGHVSEENQTEYASTKHKKGIDKQTLAASTYVQS